MKLRISPLLRLSTRAERVVRWSRRVLFLTGTVILAFVAFTLLDAAFYQAYAKRSLESQIAGQKEREISPSQQTVKEGQVLGRIDIPRLGVSVAVLQGTRSRTLRLGLGHIDSTPIPGEAGNSGIAGHRDTFFRTLKDIRRQDEIQFVTAAGLYHYEVDWMKVVEPNDSSVLAPSTDSALTLVTCYPFYFVGPAPKRFVVHAHKL
jgi:sortase A